MRSTAFSCRFCCVVLILLRITYSPGSPGGNKHVSCTSYPNNNYYNHLFHVIFICAVSKVELVICHALQVHFVWELFIQFTLIVKLGLFQLLTW